MDEKLFRQKSIDRIKSPDSLNDYIRVSNPAVWLFLAAVLVLLVGALIWACFGELAVTENVKVSVNNGVAYFVCKDAHVGDAVKIDGNQYETAQVANGIGLFAANLPNGEYEAEIVTDTVKPISFVIN